MLQSLRSDPIPQNQFGTKKGVVSAGHNGRSQFGGRSRGGSSDHGLRYCDFCDNRSHIRDFCWKLHGKPAWANQATLERKSSTPVPTQITMTKTEYDSLVQRATTSLTSTTTHVTTAMDISSDLTELGRTPIAVISAGVKSILDIPRTLEYLETQGVCVAAYQTDEFPAFFTRTSGCKAPCRIDTPEDSALLIAANLKLKLGTGILIAVPIPNEHSASGSLIESAIQKALKEARDKGITGSAETPFLLARVNELTGGASLSSNIALVKNNALVGAKIAVCLARMGENEHHGDTNWK